MGSAIRTRLTGAAARSLACAVALNLAVAAAPARAADPSPFQVVSVGPLPVHAPGPVTVRLRLQGGTQDAAARLIIAPTAVTTPRDSGYSANIREVHLEGAGGRIEPLPYELETAPMALEPRAVADQACSRGGYRWTGGYGRHAVHVGAGQSIDVVATLDVPAGLHGVQAAVTILSSPLTTTFDPWTGAPVAPDASPILLPLPRVGPAGDQVSLALARRSGERVRLSGVVLPRRPGVTVEIAGRRTPNIFEGGEVLGHERIAMAPIGPSMRRFGSATTNADGVWRAWVTLPPRVAVVARTAAEPGVTLGGASCGLWFSSPTLDQRAIDARRKAIRDQRRKDRERRARERRDEQQRREQERQRAEDRAERQMVAAAPIGVVGVEPLAERGPGEYRVRLRVTGLEVDAAMNLEVDGRYATAGPFDGRVAQVTVRDVNLDGPGRLFDDPAIKSIVFSGGCERGGRLYQSGDRVDPQLALAARTVTDVLVDIATAPGLIGSGPPELEIRSTALYPAQIDWTRPTYEAGDALPFVSGRDPEFVVRVPLPRLRVAQHAEGISLSLRRVRSGAVVATGELLSHRRGVPIEFVGTAGTSWETKLVRLRDALAPVGRDLRRFGAVRSGRGGTFTARLRVPRATELVARTPDGPGRVSAGASCGTFLR